MRGIPLLACVLLFAGTDVVATAQEKAAPDLPASFSLRPRSFEEASVSQFGGTRPAKAVLLGLRWLAVKQNEDGSWSAEDRKPILTGLALLCFGGQRYLPGSPEFGPRVRRAVEWLREYGESRHGRFTAPEELGVTGVYQQGICTYALADYYVLTRDERLRPLLTKAVACIVEDQLPEGGWPYDPVRGRASAAVVSGWQIQALVTAQLAGIDAPGLQAALEKAIEGVDRLWKDPNDTQEQKAELARFRPVPMYCRLLTGKNLQPQDQIDLENLPGQDESEHGLTYEDKKANLFAWYFSTQAYRWHGAAAWNWWSPTLRLELIEHQPADGTWPPLPLEGPGAELQMTAQQDGQVYRITMSILLLESSYRTVPPAE